jgi:N-carbamoylputrescine amidase
MAAAAPREPVVVGLVQMRICEDPARNSEQAIDLIRQAAASGASVICLPELFGSLYFCQTEDTDNFDLAEPVPGPTTDTLAALAAELEVVIVASVFERRAAGLYHNTAAVLDGERGYLGTASTAKCTFRTIRGITRSSTSRPAISASSRLRQARASSVC